MKQLRHYFLGDQLDRMDSFHKRSQTILLFNIAMVVFLTGILVVGVALTLQTFAVLVPAGGNIVLATIMLLFMKYEKLKLAAIVYFTTLFFLFLEI